LILANQCCRLLRDYGLVWIKFVLTCIKSPIVISASPSAFLEHRHHTPLNKDPPTGIKSDFRWFYSLVQFRQPRKLKRRGSP